MKRLDDQPEFLEFVQDSVPVFITSSYTWRAATII